MELTITAEPRAILGKETEKLRKQGLLPAVLYGRGKDSVSLQVIFKEFEKVYRQAGENTLVNLKVVGKGETKVLIHEVAKHYMKDEAIHVDFYEVDLTKKIHSKIPVEFTGVAPAAKELGGILVKSVNEIEVEAMPGDLPHSIEISLEALKTFESRIHLSDVKVSDKVKILGNMEEVVISVQPPRTEEELATLEGSAAEAEKAAIEGIEAKAAEEKAAKEGEGAEGEEDKKAEEKK